VVGKLLGRERLEPAAHEMSDGVALDAELEVREHGAERHLAGRLGAVRAAAHHRAEVSGRLDAELPLGDRAIEERMVRHEDRALPRDGRESGAGVAGADAPAVLVPDGDRYSDDLEPRVQDVLRGHHLFERVIAVVVVLEVDPDRDELGGVLLDCFHIRWGSDVLNPNTLSSCCRYSTGSSNEHLVRKFIARLRRSRSYAAHSMGRRLLACCWSTELTAPTPRKGCNSGTMRASWPAVLAMSSTSSATICTSFARNCASASDCIHCSSCSPSSPSTVRTMDFGKLPLSYW